MVGLPDMQLNTTVVMVDTTPFSQDSATGIGRTSNVSTLTCVSEINQASHLARSPSWHAYNALHNSMCYPWSHTLVDTGVK